MKRCKLETLYDARGRAIPAKAYFDNGYVGARSFTARSAIQYFVGDSPAELSSYTRSELMRKARYFRKNIGLARAMGKDVQAHAIGPGLFPIPDTGEKPIGSIRYLILRPIAELSPA